MRSFCLILGIKFIDRSVLLPVASTVNLFSSFNRWYNFVFLGAFNNPTIAVTIPLWLI